MIVNEPTKKVLFILHLPPPIHGAAVVGALIKNSTYLNNNFRGEYLNLSTSDLIENVGKGGIKKAFALSAIAVRVIRALTLNKYDLIYMTLTAKGSGFYKDLIIVLIVKLFGKKLVYHFHNKGFADASAGKLNDLLYRFVFWRSNSILLSPLLYPDVQKYVGPKNVFFCPNGLVDEVSSSRRQTDDSQVVKLLFLSNMMEEKGVYVLLAACRNLRDRKLLFECNFVGAWADVSEKDFHNKVQEYQLNDFVRAHGKKISAEKRSFLEGADVFVFPTYYHNEAFPLVNIEAMQWGLPVVSTCEGGIPDMIIDGVTGYLVEKHNPTALADKLADLLENPDLRKRMGHAGRRLYEERFSAETFEENLTYILKKI